MVFVRLWLTCMMVAYSEQGSPRNLQSESNDTASNDTTSNETTSNEVEFDVDWSDGIDAGAGGGAGVALLGSSNSSDVSSNQSMSSNQLTSPPPDAAQCDQNMSACSAACPGAPAFFLGMADGLTMGYLCDNAAEATCTVGEAACCMASVGMLVPLCTPETRRPVIQALLADADACASTCDGVVDALGEYMFVQQEQNLRYCNENACDGGRRLEGHGRDARERHALLEVLCPIDTEVTCFFNEDDCSLSAMGEAQMGGVQRPIIMDSCDVPMAVTVTMELTVDDPAAFVAAEGSERAIAAGIAAAAEVDVRDVRVELSVARRLEDFQNLRRLEGAVNVAATIMTGTTDSVASLQATVNLIQPATMADHLNEALSEAGVDSVTVASLTAEAAPSQSDSSTTVGPSNGPSFSTPSEDAALKTTVALSVLFALSVHFWTL